ncbi:MAG: FAD-dependent oxidoreductase [Actinomycetota bacterium]|nr:FAD-dependent oxidoreductase [Actinomycetota bacterium]
MTRRTFVTIGAGQTAAVAARNLRRRGFDGRIVLLGAEPHAPYQRPPLSKEFLAGTDDLDSLWLLPPKWLADNDIEIITGAQVQQLDTAARSVRVAGGPDVRADAVLFATGGSPRTLPAPGPRPDLIHYLRTLDDATRLAPMLTPGRRLAIVGAGFLGLELAATATAAGVDVTVIEAADVPLARVVGAAMGQAVCGLHRDAGVDLRTGTELTAIRTTEHGVLVELADGTVVDADVAVVGIGITPNVAAAAATGLHLDDGIVTDAAGRTSVPHVFAAGDVARRYSPRAGTHVRLEHFDNASRQGAAVANAMLGRDAVADDPPWFWSDQFGRNIQFVGAAAGIPVIRGDVDRMDFTGFYLRGGTVCGAFSVDRGEDIMAGRELLGREVATEALCDEDTDLWDLVYDDEQVHA